MIFFQSLTLTENVKVEEEDEDRNSFPIISFCYLLCKEKNSSDTGNF